MLRLIYNLGMFTRKEFTYTYPRRRVVRRVLQWTTHKLLALLSDLQVLNRHHFPERGPLLVIANHFSFIDPVAVLSVVPWPIEFVGGFRVPNAPASVGWLRKLWGYYPVYRGTGSQIAFRAAQAILDQEGVMGIFPEGSSADNILREPRLGAAFMAARSGAQVLPIGLDGFTQVFPSLRRGKRATVTVNVGKPFGPFSTTGRGRARRQQLEEIGHLMMKKIAELIPAERRGYYSSDPALVEAAKALETYPWDEQPEG
jgi:1-acyl-sn-glycerol-3-phosphate acyltransferase